MVDVSLNDIYHKLGGLEQSMAIQVEENRRAADKRAETYKALDEVRGEVRETRIKVDGLDERVSKMEPSLADYHEKLQQVKGAGRLGRALWWFGGVILSVAAGAATWMSWFSGKPPH